jgi:hypothetical protein
LGIYIASPKHLFVLPALGGGPPKSGQKELTWRS